jgi:outer membrane protein insertion porin family
VANVPTIFPSRRARALSLVLCAVLFVTACHEEGDIEVKSVSFEGNQAFDDGQLKDLIVTQGSGWLPWARKRFFNRSQFEADLDRLRAFYRDRGYPNAQITARAAEFNADNTEVRLRIGIDEGEPLIVEAIEFSGIDTLGAEPAQALRDLPLATGQPADRQLLVASRERATFVLEDAGYAHARVSMTEAPGAGPNRLVVRFAVEPGPLTRIGSIDVRGTSRVSENVVLRALAFKPGDLYRESQMIESQRRLRSLGIFSFGHVAMAPETPRDDATPVIFATVSEALPQRYQFGGGYGTEDGVRASFEWDHLNFLGDARQLTLETRYSRRQRGLGAEFLEPYFLTSRLSVNARIGGWWNSEPTYTSRSLGGRAGVTYRAAGRRGNLEPIDHVVRMAYRNESLRYAITPEALADLTQFEQLVALGFDPVTGSGSGRVAAIDVDLERIAVDNERDPHDGHTAALRLTYAAPWLGGTFRYRELLGEGTLYLPIGSRHVAAGRARIGSIFSRSPLDVPFSHRYFLGGSTSLRGWGRFQVAPLTPDGLPVGGRTMVELSTELRLALFGKFGAVLFVDAGNVWDESGQFAVGDLLVDAGPGLRYSSPVGIIRADFGYQLTRIPGLIVNGEPERRRWRVHFSLGHPF